MPTFLRHHSTNRQHDAAPICVAPCAPIGNDTAFAILKREDHAHRQLFPARTATNSVIDAGLDFFDTLGANFTAVAANRP